MKRKFLAWLMTLAMVFNMVVPYAAYADELPVGDDTYVSADGTDLNNDDTTDDVEGEPTVGEPSTDDEPAVGEPSDEEPAVDPVDGNENNAESDGKEVGEEPADEPQGDEEPVGDDEPVGDEPKADEQPATDVVAGLLGNFAAQALNEGIMPVAETGKAELIFSPAWEESEIHKHSYGSSFTLSVDVTQYKDAEGNTQNIPEGTYISYKWYKNDSWVYGFSGNTMTPSDLEAGKTYKFMVRATVYLTDETVTTDSGVYTAKIGLGDTTATGYLTLNNQGVLGKTTDGTMVAKLSVKDIKDLNNDYMYSVNEFLQAAHTQYMAGGYVAADSEGAFTISKLWGVDTSNVKFYVNGVVATETADKVEFADGDEVYVSINSGSDDVYTKLALVDKLAIPNNDFKLALTDINGNAVSGVKIGTWENGAFKDFDTPKIADENGQITLNLSAGDYVFTANGTVDGKQVMAPYCKVSVALPGGTLGTTTTWEYNPETKTLTIAGTGTTGSKKPWELDYKSEIEKLVVGEGVTDLGASFKAYPALKSVSFPATLTNIEWQGFMNCTELTTISFAEKCKAALGGWTFLGCTKLTEVTLPAAVTAGASGGDFANCTALTKATIGSAGANMFAGCSRLTEVVYLEGATSFGNSTFQALNNSNAGNPAACTTLTKVYVPASLTEWGNNPFPMEIIGNLTFEGPGAINFQTADGIVYNKDKTKLLAAVTLPTGSFEVPASVTAIGDSALSGATGLTAVTFAEDSKLESIGGNAFKGCAKLASITFPDTLKTIGSSAFNGCAELSGVTLPGKLESIGSNAFYQCAKIAAMTLPEGLTSLGSDALAGTAIEELTLPKSLTTVNPISSNSSAAPCEKLTKLVILGDVTSIPKSFLSGCRNITSAVFPKTVTSFASSGAWPYNYNNGPKFIYWGGTKAQFDATDLGKYATFKTYCNRADCSIIYNYVMPTTEDGKLEVVSYPDAITADVEAMNTQTISLQLKYPDGTSKQDGDKIWVDWYYTQKTPNGLDATKALSDYTFDESTMTATITLSEQAAAGATGTWNYIMVAFKTTADGKTTMLVGNPVAALQLGSGFTLAGKGTATEPFEITSYDDFKLVAGLVNNGSDFANTVFKLTADITVPKDNAVQMGKSSSKPFSGIFDGNSKTVTYEKGAKPMFGTVNNGTVKNLNIRGEYIVGAGLANSIVGSMVDGCKVLADTKTQSAALANSASMAAKFVNCEIADGVVCGWDDENGQSMDSFTMGSICGSGVGVSIISCKSGATVYGKNDVGGLIGSQGTWNGVITVKNSQFTGKVIASGEYVGGIMGRGYDNYTAPNARCSSIENCLVTADISGARAVGGIFGGEGGVDQCYDASSASSIRNNVFIGKLELNGNEVVASTANAVPANTIDGTKGGIFGFMRSLNKYNYIENNFYYVTNDSEAKGFGAVEHVDTSAKPFSGTTKTFTGEGDDTPLKYYENFTDVFYYSTARDSVAAIKNFVDREDYGKADWTSYTSVINRNYNRTDDPLGADADKLLKSCTADEMTNGTVVKLLNDDANSMHNWVQGTNGPELSDKAVAYQLEISGNYKTEYYVGDTLDMSGAKFTATWTDGTTTYPELKDVTITGFDSSKRAVLTLTATYGAASTTFEVKVLLKGGSEGGNSGNTGSSTIKVYFTLLGDYHHEYEDDPTLIHTYKKGNLETWLGKEAYTVDLNATVADLLEEVEKKHDNVSFSNPKGNWVDTVTFGNLTMTQLDNTDNSGWQYNVNKKHTELLISEYFLNNGDSVIFYWTDDYTQDMGSEGYDNSGNQLGGGGGSTTTETNYTATEVIDLIDAIGTVTKDSKSAIEKARAAYDSLTEAQQKKVTNYDKLTAAEAKYTELTGEKIEVSTNSDLPFADVKAGAWYYDAIKAMYDKGLMNGEGEKQFMPNNKLSRAMLVTILYRLAEQPEVNADALFDDVAAGQWYTKAVAWASSNNIVSGVGEGKFAPNASITRQELAAMLYRYASATGLNTTATANLSSFSDGAKVATWAESAMQWAVGTGLIKGDENGALNPTGTATRAEVATVIVRLIEMSVR